MLNLFGAKQPVLFLLLCLFAFFASQSHCEEIRDYASLGSPSDVLEARTGETSTSDDKVGIPSIVLSLWKQAARKAPVNNKFIETALDPSKSTIITTGTCYGCTAVAMCSGKTCIMAHFREVNGKVNSWMPGDESDASFEENVEASIEEAMLTYKTKLGESPFAVVFTPDTAKGTFKYKPRIEGAGSIESTILKDFPKASVLNIAYNYNGAKGDFGDDEVWGKIVLEWRGGKTDCAADTSDKSKTSPSVLNLYAEESWHRSFRFDDSGNPVSAASSRCSSPQGTEDVTS